MSDRLNSRNADSDPIDVAAVNRDDAFINDLAAGRPVRVTTDSDHDLAMMITAWRMDVLSAPACDQPTLAQIDAALANQPAAPGSFARKLRIFSGAAAMIAVLGAGVMVLSEGAEPGDPLWAVKEVVFSEQAAQTKARITVEGDLREAEAARDRGDAARARDLINEAEANLPPVQDKAQIARLRDRISDLRDEDVVKPPPTPPSSTPSTSPSTSEPPTSEEPVTSTTDEPVPSTSDSTEPSTSTSKSSRPSSSASSQRQSSAAEPLRFLFPLDMGGNIN